MRTRKCFRSDTRSRCAAFFVALVVLPLAGATGQETSWTVESRSLPLPAAASPELRASIGSAPAPNVAAQRGLPRPGSDAEWEAFIQQFDAAGAVPLEAVAEQNSVSIERGEIEGVKVYHVNPAKVNPAHEGHVFLHVHGGGYVFGGGDQSPGEAAVVVSRVGIRSVSVDYRMPPKHPSPAAVDDTVVVYKHLLKSHDAKSIAIGGTSAGGGLTLATIHKLVSLGLDLPGAIYLGTPWADVTLTSDSLFTNEGIDRVLVTPHGLLPAIAELYAGGADLKNPLISPIYGDFKGFPPAILITGTRDMFLSDTARTHRKLRAAGVVADLHVYEGMSHAGYLFAADSPESKDAFKEVAAFFRTHLK